MGMCDNHSNSEKEIVGVSSQNASKRLLPPWLRNSVKTFTSDTQAIPKAPAFTPTAEIAAAKTSRRKSISAECKDVVKRRRKLSEHDSRGDGNATHKDKKKKVASLTTSSKRGPHPNCHDDDDDDDDDMELTMEDLMAIAQEYVKDHDKKKQKEATNSQSESLTQFIKTGEYENSLDSHCERQRSSTSVREGLYSSTSNNTSDLVPTRTSQACDPAQEMLEILLGPLLKPLEKEKEKEKNKSIIDSVEFTRELPAKNQVQLSGEDKVPLTKRKCSLKDKVGLFLD